MNDYSFIMFSFASWEEYNKFFNHNKVRYLNKLFFSPIYHTSIDDPTWQWLFSCVHRAPCSNAHLSALGLGKKYENYDR